MPSSCRGQCWFLFPVAVVLLAGGCAALVLLGLPAVRQYSVTRHLRTYDCQVVAVQYFDNRSCDGATGHTSSSSATTFYPCVLITVRYNDDVSVVGARDVGNVSDRAFSKAAVLYRTLADAERTRQRNAMSDVTVNSTCSIRACHRDSSAENAVDVHNFVANEIGVKSPPAQFDETTAFPLPVRRCYVDQFNWDTNDDHATFEHSATGLPQRRRRAFVEVVTGDRVVHTLWWSSLAIGAGLFLFVVAVCQLCYEARSCRRCCCCSDDGDDRYRSRRRATSSDLPDVVGGAKIGISGSGSTCSTCERATLTTGTSLSSGTNSSRRSKSSRSSGGSNRSLLPTSATSTARSTRSSAVTAATELKTSGHMCIDHKLYESNTV